MNGKICTKKECSSEYVPSEGLFALRIQVPEFLKIVTTKNSDIRVIRAKNIFAVLAHNRSFPLETKTPKPKTAFPCYVFTELTAVNRVCQT